VKKRAPQQNLPTARWVSQPKESRQSTESLESEGNKKIEANWLYARLQHILKPSDIVVVETSTCMFGMGVIKLPEGATYHSQALWGAIGWATPAAFGAALANPSRRVVLVTGEGSHQVSVQELGQFSRFNLSPLIFVMNNKGYLIERLLSNSPDGYYNDVPDWRYTELPHALGMKNVLTERLETRGQLERAVARLEEDEGEGGEERKGAIGRSKKIGYFEVITDKMDAPFTARKMQEVKKQKEKQSKTESAKSK